MRANRLVATVLLLQQRGRVSAAEVARELEVSVPTARRDLEALAAAGVPVYPQPGRGGGWQLVGGARTDLSGLSSTEAQALFLRLGPTADASPQARGTLRKLLQALPATFREDAEAAAAATMMDRARWGESDRPRPPLVERLQEAVVGRRRVRLTYADARGTHSDRTVEPWGLVDKFDVWYLVAGTDRGRRTFRVDRIAEVEWRTETFDRPDNLVLDQEWRDTVAAMEERRSRTWATLRVEQRWVRILRVQFGRHCEVGDVAAEGWAQVRVAAPTALDLARTLAGWGGQVEVLDPPAVRDQLARIGAELTAAYG